MVEKQQDKATETTAVSPLVRDKTYGERVYGLVFNQLINFWANLLLSAGFSLFAASARTKIRVPGLMKEAATPAVVQTRLIDRIENSFIIRSMGESATAENKRKRAVAVTEIVTLLMPGHLIMIPSVWLGAKFKPAIVRHFDKKHYGENAEDDPSIAVRHQLIDAEAKPTLLGATVGRIGTMAMTTTAGRLIGSEENTLNKLKGFKDFPGLNQVAYRIGTVAGEGLTQETKVMNRLNKKLSKRFDWSEKQIERGLNQGTYNRAIPDYIGFVAMDTLYTMVTASVIHPIMSVLRHVPGMTYTTAPKPAPLTTTKELQVKVPKNRMAVMADAKPIEAKRDDEASPKIQVSDIKHVDRVNHPQQEVSAR